MSDAKLSHINEAGEANMVDVSGKACSTIYAREFFQNDDYRMISEYVPYGIIL